MVQRAMRTKNGATPPSRVADASLTYIREHSAGDVAVAHSVLAVTRSPEEIAAADSLLELSRSATPESRYFPHTGPSNTSVVSPLISMGRISKSSIPEASKAQRVPKASNDGPVTEYRAQRPKRKAQPSLWAPKQVEGGLGEDDTDEEFEMVSSEDEFVSCHSFRQRAARANSVCSPHMKTQRLATNVARPLVALRLTDVQHVVLASSGIARNLLWPKRRI